MKIFLALVFTALVALAGRADAYPQFQLNRDRTCANCHMSPSGGGLLNEYGLMQAELISQDVEQARRFGNAAGR